MKDFVLKIIGKFQKQTSSISMVVIGCVLHLRIIVLKLIESKND